MTVPPRRAGGLPWLGHAAAFSRDPVTFLRDAQNQLGDILSFRLLGRQVVFLCGPAANDAVFRAGDDLLSAKEAYKFMTPVFGEGVAYDVEPEVMDEQLRLVLPSLTSRRLHTYAALMAAEAEANFSQWPARGEVDLLETLNEVTVAIASRCLFGEQFRSQLTAELASLYHDLESGIRLGALFSPYLPLPAFRRRDRARVRLTKFIMAVMAERRSAGVTSGEDFLGTLMDARYADGTALPDQTIAGLILSLIFAGQHTSTVLAAWTGVLMLENTDWIPHLLKEQQQVFSSSWNITVPALRQLSALECCIKEAERMHPPVTTMVRVALQSSPTAATGLRRERWS